MDGIFRASAVWGDTASCRRATKNEWKSSCGSFWKLCSYIKKGGSYFLSFLEIVPWLHHYEVPLKSAGRSSHYCNSYHTNSPNSYVHSSLCPKLKLPLLSNAQNRACIFPLQIPWGYRQFLLLLMCLRMFKRQIRLQVYSVLRSFKVA